MISDILNTKIDLIQWLTTLEDSNVINKIIDIKNSYDTQSSKLSVKEEESINKGISDADNGKLKPHSEARKIYEKWL